MTEKVCFASDNFAPAHPRCIEAMEEANVGFAPSYGADKWTAHLDQLLGKEFGRSPKVFINPNGTGSNVLALKIACKRHESVICTDIAHMNFQESGAPESIVGCKLLSVPHQNGKLLPEEVLKRLELERIFGKHSTSPRVLAITQPTEVGTVYSLEELHALSQLCKNENLLLHMDGSRLFNAVVYLGCSFSEITNGIDTLYLGGTKNGLICAEALLLFNKDLFQGAGHLHKQTLQLVSKNRYLAAQFIPYFEEKLWHMLATHANQKANEIASIIKSIPNLSLSYPAETNQLFVQMPKQMIEKLQEKILCYVWDSSKNEVRLITSWYTSEEDILGFKSAISN